MGNAQQKAIDIRKKDDVFQRRGSVSWNFRYGHRKSQYDDCINIHNPELGIKDWLHLLALDEYAENFASLTFVGEVSAYKNEDLIKMGVSNSKHRKKMLASISELQAMKRMSINFEGANIEKRFDTIIRKKIDLKSADETTNEMETFKRNNRTRKSLSNLRKSFDSFKLMRQHKEEPMLVGTLKVNLKKAYSVPLGLEIH